MRAGDRRDIVVVTVAVTVAVTVGGDLVRRRNIGDAECIACLLEGFGAAVVGKDAEMADALHAGGKDMQEEAVGAFSGEPGVLSWPGANETVRCFRTGLDLLRAVKELPPRSVTHGAGLVACKRGVAAWGSGRPS